MSDPFSVPGADPGADPLPSQLLYLAQHHPEHLVQDMEALLQQNPDIQGTVICEVAQLLDDLNQRDAARQLYQLALSSGQLADPLAWEVRLALPRLILPESVTGIQQYWEQVGTFLANLVPPQVSPLQPDLSNLNPYLNTWEALNALSHMGRNPLPLRQAYSRWFEALLPAGLRQALPGGPGPVPRIGLVLNHTVPVELFYLGLFQRLQPVDFQLYLIYTSPKTEAVLAPLQLPATQSLTLGKGPLLAELQAIRELNLDLLFLTEANTDRLLQTFMSLCRLARRQCTSLLSSASTGSSQMDFFVSSHQLETPAEQELYSEKLVLFDHMPLFVRRPWRPEEVPARAEFGLPEEGPIYVCPHVMLKFHPDFDALLGAILRQDPQGQLVLVTNPNSEVFRNRLLARFEKTLADVMSRIWFLPRLTPVDFLSLLRLADVMLDPLYFGAGATAYEALGLELPLVTWPGALNLGRITLGCYRQMGVLDCVASNQAEYVELAVRLANDRPFNQAVRAKLRQNNHKLFEDKQVVQEFSRFFKQAQTLS